jgi:DNA-binding CsgD family transcriptional regulator
MTRPPSSFYVEPGKVLTRREQEVLSRVVSGKTPKTIADELGISERTTQTHLKSLAGKVVGGSVRQKLESFGVPTVDASVVVKPSSKTGLDTVIRVSGKANKAVVETQADHAAEAEAILQRIESELTEIEQRTERLMQRYGL